ncbi:hypothetical protein H4R26_002793 [Coemansia thaxteri]|uniref:Ubiquitin-like protease family profile domain-containing protein n=1 Tax=Coemansia thaxteri TaxID=2663907 RepID=A0A9W8BKB1_9FUNG|nr:hypothetical protein H4R26_002793 [Coemansia thaxteri]
MQQDTLLFSYHDTAVYSSDPMSLREGQWLNDTMVSFYYEYLTHKVLCGDNSVLTSTFHYYDSLANSNYQYALETKVKMDCLLFGNSQSAMTTHSCPQQENGSDCGVFVILFTDLLARRYSDLRLPQSPPSQRPLRLSGRSPAPALPRQKGRKYSAEPETVHTAHSAALACRQSLSSSLPNTARPTGLDSGDEGTVICRPFSPFAAINNGAVNAPQQQQFRTFRPAMLLAPVFSRTFWWIDYGDLCHPVKARITLQSLVNEHCPVM